MEQKHQANAPKPGELIMFEVQLKIENLPLELEEAISEDPESYKTYDIDIDEAIQIRLVVEEWDKAEIRTDEAVKLLMELLENCWGSD